LAGVGFPIPPNANPADFVLNLVNADFTNPAIVHTLVAWWASICEAEVRELTLAVPAKHAGLRPSPSRYVAQIFALVAHQLRSVARTPRRYYSRIIEHIYFCTLTGGLLLGGRERTQQSIVSKFFSLIQICAFTAGGSSRSLRVLINERNAAVADMSRGLYSPSAFALSTGFVSVLVAQVMFYPGITILYCCVDFHFPSLPRTVLILSCVAIAFDMYVHILSTLELVQAQLIYLSTILISAMFSSIYLPLELMIWPFRALHYIVPLPYALRSFAWSVFIDTPPYTGAEVCALNFSCPAGYRCDSLDVACLGVNGDQILDSIGERVFTLFGSEDTYMYDASMIILIALVYKILHIYALHFLHANVKTPEIPNEPPPRLLLSSNEHLDDEPIAHDADAEVASTLQSGNPVSQRMLSCFTFRHCSYVVSPRQKPKKWILRDVSGSSMGGQTCAMMGPSGAGKTTLLNLITFKNTAGKPFGELVLNGAPFTPQVFKHLAALVEQTDTVWSFLTCVEHLRFVADVSPSARTHRSARRANLDLILGDIGLKSSEHVRATSLSGGQKRRLSVALALLKQPSLLFLDEPTSGLDGTSAAAVMAILGKEAAQGRAILCTIHQPSIAIFEGFDRLLILSLGCVAYCGPTVQLPYYLAGVGFPIPPNANPADFVLNLVNADFTDPQLVDVMLALWNNTGSFLAHVVHDNTATHPPLSTSNSWWAIQLQSPVLLWRQASLALRDPAIWNRVRFYVVTSSIMSIMYMGTREHNQSQPAVKIFHATILIAVFQMYVSSNTTQRWLQHSYIRIEARNGMYSPLSYCVAMELLSIPLLFIFSLACWLPPHILCGWNLPGLPFLLGSTACGLWTFEGVGCLFATLHNYEYVQTSNALFRQIGDMLSGQQVRPELIIWPFRALAYLWPNRPYQESIMWSIFMFSPHYAGASLCEVGPRCALGYRCLDAAEYACVGVTGPQVLRSMSLLFGNVPADINYLLHNGRVLSVGLFARICYVYAIHASVALRKPSLPR